MFALLLAVVAADPIPPTQVVLPPGTDKLAGVMAAVYEQTGLQWPQIELGVGPPVRVPKEPQPLWRLIELVAGGRRIVVLRDGDSVAFVAPPPTPATWDGAFRLAVGGVTCRHDYQAGPPTCEVTLALHWEPRLAVVRVTAGAVAAGTFAVEAGSGKVAVAGARHNTTARLTGVPRSAAKLASLDVAFTVTAAERMLTFTVPELAAPKPLTVAGITLTPRPARKLDATTEFRLDLLYPEGHPEFESFETWTAGNRCRLVHRDGRALDTDDFNESQSGRRVTLDYRFPTAEVGDLAGWTLDYRTPGPLREFPVRFKLTDIPLP